MSCAYSIISNAFIVIGIILVIAFLMHKANRSARLIKLLRNENLLFVFLILWNLFGFFTQQDFIESCNSPNFPDIYSLDNVFCSSLSLILLLLGLMFNNKLFRIFIVSLELVYWIFKLFALVSGYRSYGLIILIYKYYDFISLLARLLLLNALIESRFKEYKLVLLCGLLLILKVITFPCSENFIEKDFVIPYKNRMVFNKINGNWTGSMLYPRDSNIWWTIENPDTTMYGNVAEINLSRDTVLFTRFGNVLFSFKDSILSIEKTDPKLNGNYYLTYSQPDGAFFVYIPVKYKEAVKEDNMLDQYSITFVFNKISDSVLSCKINNRIDLSLVKCR